jgi:DNA-binding MarR family transcriptional regulator
MSSQSPDRAQILDALIGEIRGFIASAILFNQKAADRLGINLTDCQCLNILQMTGAIPAGRLAELTGLTTGTITGVIDRLEKARFVQRVRDPGDRRRVIVQPIPDREDEIKQIYAAPGQATANVLASYSDQDIVIILSFFSQITNQRKEINHDRIKLESGDP